LLQRGDKRQHFVALDSLRGICALAVVLFHFRTNGWIANIGFVRHSWMFVDFFFVLSGFVIAAAYADRFIARSVSIGSFMTLRMGRIYPLHLAVLGAMVLTELSMLIIDFSGVTARTPFQGSRSVGAIVSNLGLLQSFGVHDFLTWNGPSWSIAAEMWMYLLFALIFSAAGKQAWRVLALVGGIALGVLVIASPGALNTTFSLGFVRCVYGFAAGVGAWWLFQRGLGVGGTWAEMISAAAAIAFVSLISAGPATFLAPVIFALPVVCFARQQGKIAALLTRQPFVGLGTISYSIYMVHAYVQARIGDVIKAVDGLFGLHLSPQTGNSEFPSEIIVGPDGALGVLTLAMIGIVVGVSWVSYRWIEKPCRDWSRHRVRQR
jgi:peptidoglycan/LPS O-acetylase OafA/YrhL